MPLGSEAPENARLFLREVEAHGGVGLGLGPEVVQEGFPHQGAGLVQQGV